MWWQLNLDIVIHRILLRPELFSYTEYMFRLTTGLDVNMNKVRWPPDYKVHGANMGPTWVLSAPCGPMLAPWILLSGGAKCDLLFCDICVANERLFCSALYVCKLFRSTCTRTRSWPLITWCDHKVIAWHVLETCWCVPYLLDFRYLSLSSKDRMSNGCVNLKQPYWMHT